MKILNSSPGNFTIEFNTFDSNGLPIVQHITNNNDQILFNTHNTEPLQQLLSDVLEPIKEGKTTEIEGFNAVFFFLVRHCKRIFAMLSNDINTCSKQDFMSCLAKEFIHLILSGDDEGAERFDHHLSSLSNDEYNAMKSTWSFYSDITGYHALLKQVSHYHVFEFLQQYEYDINASNPNFFQALVEDISDSQKKQLIQYILCSHWSLQSDYTLTGPEYDVRAFNRELLFELIKTDAPYDLIPMMSREAFGDIPSFRLDPEYEGIDVNTSDEFLNSLPVDADFSGRRLFTDLFDIIQLSLLSDDTTKVMFLNRVIRNSISMKKYELLELCFNNQTYSCTLDEQNIILLAKLVLEDHNGFAYDMLRKFSGIKYFSPVSSLTIPVEERNAALNFIFNMKMSEEQFVAFLELIPIEALFELDIRSEEYSAMLMSKQLKIINEFNTNELVLDDKGNSVTIYVLEGADQSELQQIKACLTLTPNRYKAIQKISPEFVNKLKAKMTVVQKFKVAEHIEPSQYDALIEQDVRFESLLLNKSPYLVAENHSIFQNMAPEMDGKICHALRQHNIETVVQTMSQETFFQTRLYYPETTQYLVDTMPLKKCLQLGVSGDEWHHRWPIMSFNEKSSFFMFPPSKEDQYVFNTMTDLAEEFRKEILWMMVFKGSLVVVLNALILAALFLLLPLEIAVVSAVAALCALNALLWPYLVEHLHKEINHLDDYYTKHIGSAF